MTIDAVLVSHRVRAQVIGGTATPRLVRFKIAPALGTRLGSILRLKEELAAALGAPACRLSRNGATVDLEVPRACRKPLELTSLLRGVGHIPASTAMLGLDTSGRPLLLRLSSPEVAHVLISGTTGSGKTALARSLLASLATFNGIGELGLVVIDPKGTGLGPLAGLPHALRPAATDALEAVAALRWTVQAMEHRLPGGQTGDQSRAPRVVVAIDELADLLQMCGQALAEPLARLVQRGRQAGIHVIACTQKPLSSVVGSLIKSNFPTRIAGAVPSPEDARVATGVAASGAESLLGRGDFILAVRGQTHRFQAAYLGSREVGHLVEQLGAGLAVTRTPAGRDTAWPSQRAPSVSVANSDRPTKAGALQPWQAAMLRPMGSATGVARAAQARLL
jgi:S-DNA-T family DNA segregation ATPase FtsK/SpoIIIE